MSKKYELLGKIAARLIFKIVPKTLDLGPRHANLRIKKIKHPAVVIEWSNKGERICELRKSSKEFGFFNPTVRQNSTNVTS